MLISVVLDLVYVINDTLQWIENHPDKVTVYGIIGAFLLSLLHRIGVGRVIRLFGYKDKSEVREYVENQRRIELKLDQIMNHMGVKFCADSLIPSTTSLVKRNKMSSIWRWVVSTIAQYAKRYTNLNMRRKTKMKSKLASRKFWVAVISAILVVLNDGLGLGIDTDTVMAFAGIVMTYILGQAHVDSKKAANQDNAANYYR